MQGIELRLNGDQALILIKLEFPALKKLNFDKYLTHPASVAHVDARAHLLQFAWLLIDCWITHKTMRLQRLHETLKI